MNENPRILTPQELALMVQMLRDGRKWSQETLASLSGLSVRTVQRVERGQPSDLDTRRALAVAFGSEDVDVFNKPYEIPTSEEQRKANDKFQRDHLTLETTVTTSGRELATLFAASTMDLSQPCVELDRESEERFAGMVDNLRDYRDCADVYSEVQRLDVYREIQDTLDALRSAGVSVCCSTRKTTLAGSNWVDKTPWPVTVLYVFAFGVGKEPSVIAVEKAVRIG
jgi:transcriptional regulator with XRE-family HTH domain